MHQWVMSVLASLPPPWISVWRPAYNPAIDMTIRRRPFRRDSDVGALVDAARSGDAEALAALFEHCESTIVGAILARGINQRSDMFEAAQSNAFEQIWKSIGGFRGEAAICTWMASIVRRSTNSRILKPAIRLRDHERSFDSDDEFGVSGWEDAVAGDAVIERLFAELREDYREVLAYRLVLGWSVEDTARHLGLEPGTVRSRLNRAKRAAIVILRQLGVEP